MSSSPRFLTTKELAALLRIKERKVYELVANNEVPCSRATGKLLFPQDAVNEWLARNGSGFTSDKHSQRPAVVLGSHDPLLDWAIRESGSGLATYYDGSEDGLTRFANHEGVLTGLHLFDVDTASWNSESVKQYCLDSEAALIEFAWRERGLLVAKDNPLNITGLADLTTVRVASRQTGAGADVLFRYHLQQHDILPDSLNSVTVARTETDAAGAVSSGEADVSFGLQCVAEQFQLSFISITRERFDLLVDRRAWFEPACQTLFTFLRSDAFRQRLAKTVGYDASGFETVHFNGS